MTSKALKEQRRKEAIRKSRLQIVCIIGGIAIVVGLSIRWTHTSSQTTPPTKDERRIAMETAACTPSLAWTTRYIGYGCYEYCNWKQREKKSWCSDSPDNSQERSGQPCVGLPTNAQRNGASSIDQVWDGSKRYPTTTGRYNEEVSNGECTFKCKVGFSWNATSHLCSVMNWNFNYTGNPQTFIAPHNGEYEIELWGAQGWNGGYGGYTKGVLSLSSGDTLQIYVGGQGLSSPNATTAASGGWNGGASSVTTESDTNNRGGWGATDIRFGSTSLNARIMVAGGGGGKVAASDVTHLGYGGGLIGSMGCSTYTNYVGCGYGGTQVAGGTYSWNSSVSANGNFGTGGSGKRAGGGWGYYGGWGSYIIAWWGSSFISGYTGAIAVFNSSSTTPRNASNGTTCTETLAATDIVCSYHYSGKIFTNGEMKAGNEEMPNPRGTGTITGNPGNEYAKITWRGD